MAAKHRHPWQRKPLVEGLHLLLKIAHQQGRIAVAGAEIAVAVGEVGERGLARGDRGHAALEQRHEGEHLAESPASERAVQAGHHHREDRGLERRVGGPVVELHRHWGDDALGEQLLPVRPLHVVLEPADDVAAVVVAAQGASPVDEARVEQLDEAGEVAVVAVVR
ncbi:MAG: hypothetical protein ACK559_18795, partial [bacterium]